MSYLPRMSKTYKEPQEINLGDLDEPASPNTLKPASSLLNEKTFNPQMALRHYRYIPHAPPVLPGPSVLDEVLENELMDEVNRLRRSESKVEGSLSKGSPSTAEQPSIRMSEEIVEESESKPDIVEKKRGHGKKSVKGSKTNVGKKKSGRLVKKENSSNVTVNMCLTGSGKPFTAVPRTMAEEGEEFLSTDKLNSLKREKSVLPIASVKPEVTPKSEKEEKPKVKRKEYANRSLQCLIYGSPNKVFVIPPLVNSLLRTLAFLLHEIKKEYVGGEGGGEKFPLAQIQMILGDLCNQKPGKDFGFDITYSDSKRVEKIYGELQKYITDTYGDKEEVADKMEDFKRVFIESKIKEMELAVLEEKVQEKEEKPEIQVEVREEDFKCPEITLQNKRLENEQLSAEVEFSTREMRKYQMKIAELDWDIRNCQEQVIALKKSAGSKSKTEVLGRKSSIHKFSSELLPKVVKSKGRESGCEEKT